MDNNELKTLEEKARSIVDALDILEEETKEYQKKNIDIVSAITNLANISEQVDTASKELSSAAALFSNSDFSKAMKELDKRIDKINEAEVVFADQTKVVNSIAEKIFTENKNLSSDINAVNKSLHEILEMQHAVYETKNSLEMLAVKIDRIEEEVLEENRNLRSDIKEVNENIHEILEMQQIVYETKKSLEMLTAIIGRIDRNTQKGFGKERE